MDTIVSHTSALEAWANQIASRGVPWPIARVRHAAKFDKESTRRAAGLLSLSEPVHVLVENDGARRQSSSVHCHVWGRDLPPRAIARVAPGIFVAAPEFLFLQAAHSLPFNRLVEFGYELCSLYTCRLSNRDYVELPQPLTTVARIESFLEGCNGMRGIQAARNAIRWVRGRTRSPREGKFAISLLLPRMRGGQGTGDIELNYRIELTRDEQRASGRRFFEIDLYDPTCNVGFEYYGKEFHTGKIREIRDIRRESILAGKGITIHGVTKEQSQNVQELERFAKLLCDARGLRWRQPSVKQERAMRALLRELYFSDNASISSW